MAKKTEEYLEKRKKNIKNKNPNNAEMSKEKDTKNNKAKNNKKNSDVCCCELINKNKYDKKTWKWKNKIFFARDIVQMFHMPIGFGDVMRKDYPKVFHNDLVAEPMWLYRETGKFKAEILIPLNQKTAIVPTKKITGTFVSKYFEVKGFKETGETVKDMLYYCESKKYNVKSLLFFYAQCPKCVKKLGKLQVVVFAEI